MWARAHSCVPWLIHMCSHSFICSMIHSYVPWLSHMCHDSLICAMTDLYVPWRIHMCHDSVISAVTHSCEVSSKVLSHSYWFCCVCVCVSVCVSVCVCECVCECVCVCMYVLCVCASLGGHQIHRCLPHRAWGWMSFPARTCMCYTCIHTHIHIHAYTHTHTHTFIHIYIQAYMHILMPSGWDMLQHVAVCCSVLQCVAVCSSVLQCVTVFRSVSQYSYRVDETWTHSCIPIPLYNM